MSISSQEFESYVPVYDVIPEKWEDARPFIVEQLKKITNSLNFKEIGFFLDQELLSGKAFFNPTDPQQFRTILRKVIDFGALPNATTKSVPHGIVFDSNFSLIQLFASSTDPIALLAIPIPFVSTVSDIELVMTSNNINITTGINRSNFTRTFVVIEYIQEL